MTLPFFTLTIPRAHPFVNDLGLIGPYTATEPGAATSVFLTVNRAGTYAITAGAGSTTVTADETLVAAAASTRLFYLIVQEDAAAGAAVACMAAVVATQLARLRPGVWSWREAPDQAAA